MELDKHSAWKSNDVKSRQPPSDKNAVLVNGHKPIVNPLYDDDEFDVDTETPFLTALATADVPKQNQIADGGKEYNNQTVEDGEILDNSNEEAAVNDRKTHRNAAKSSKNNDKSRRASKSRSGKSNNHSPERRLSSSRFRERSSSCGDRDKERRPKTADAEKARESMNRDKRDTKRDKIRDRRDSQSRKSDSKLRSDSKSNRYHRDQPRDSSGAPPTTINKNVRYTKCVPSIAYADNGRYPQIVNEKSKRSEPNASDAKPNADCKKSRKPESSKVDERSSKRSRHRSRSKTKSKSPTTKPPKNCGEKKPCDLVGSGSTNDSCKDERKNRVDTKQSERLEWKDVQRKSMAANELAATVNEDSQPVSQEEFHTIPLNLNISKQKHHFENRTKEKALEKPSPPKCQPETVRDDEPSETIYAIEMCDEVNKPAKAAKDSKRKNEPKIALMYDEYDEFLLNENGDAEKETIEGTQKTMPAAESLSEDAEEKIESPSIEPEATTPLIKSERTQKVAANVSPPPEIDSSREKRTTESNGPKIIIEIESERKLEQSITDELTDATLNKNSKSEKVRAREFRNESSPKTNKLNASSGGEANSKSREKLPASKRKHSTSSSSSSSSSSTSSTDSSSSSSSSDDDSSSSSSSDSNSTSSADDSETSSTSSSNGKQHRVLNERELITASPITIIPTVSDAVDDESKMPDSNFEKLASQALQTLGFNLDEELLSDTNALLQKVESFKQCLEKRKAKQKNAVKPNESDHVPDKSTVVDETAITDPNRSSIQLKMSKPLVSTASIFDGDLEHGRDKQSATSNSSCIGSSKEADTSDDSKRSSHRNRDSVRQSRGDDDRSRRRSSDRHRKRSEDDHKKSSTHRTRKSSRHRSRSPHSSKYASRNRDRRSTSRSRRSSRERHGSVDHGSKRRFTSPRLPRRSTSRNRSLASPIESRRRSLSPGRSYKQSPPQPWHRYDRRSPFAGSCSPNRCVGSHRNGDHIPRNSATASRGPRTPPNTPPSENNALYDRYGDRGNARSYADHRSSPDVNHFTTPQYSSSSGSDAAYPPSAETTYAAGQHPAQNGPSRSNHIFREPPGNPSGFGSVPLTPTPRHGAYSAPIHPPTLNPAMNHSHAPVLGSGDGYYYQTMFLPSPMFPGVEQQHTMQPQRPFAPYPNQPQYGNSPINSMQMKRPPMRKPERKSTIVQKGNVLEIVPGLELQQDATTAAPSESNAETMPKVETPPLSDEQILQMERLKRKKERQQRRLAKEKRKEFVINEIKRLSQQFIVGEDGKMIKAGELLKTSSFGKYVNGSPKLDTNANDQNDTSPSPQPIQLYDYDANAKVGKSIIVNNADPSNRELTTHRKKIVVFADGIMPGEGTSASENSSDGDEFSTKRAIARSKNRKRNPRNSPSISPNDINSAIDKENSDENKLALKSDMIGRCEESDENFVPGPPDGSPMAHLKQPRLKCPEKFIGNQLIYFHYNQFEHAMYVSPYANPTHSAPPAKQMQSAIPTVITTQPTYAYNKHKVQMDSPKDMKVASRTPLSVQQKSFHSTESNLIVVQSNSPTMNYSTNESTANNYSASPMQYMPHAHQQASPAQQPIPTHYTSQSPIQTYRTHTPIVTHQQPYQMATPTQNYMQSPQIANNIYPTSI